MAEYVASPEYAPVTPRSLLVRKRMLKELISEEQRPALPPKEEPLLDTTGS